MENYTPDTVTWHATIPSVQDGDAPNETNFRATSDALADNLGWLRVPYQGPAVRTRYMATGGTWQVAQWEPSAACGGFVSTVVGSGFVWWPLDLAQGMTLTAFGVLVKGGAGHGALPAQRPRVRLVRGPLDGSAVPTVLVEVTDSAASVVAYEDEHVVTGNAGPLAIDTSLYAYWLYVVNESGANSAIGLEVSAPRVTFLPGQYPGGL